MGCVFCATGQSGLIRNLESGEMLGQLLSMENNPSKIVLMGMGEPLDNYDNTIKFLELAHDPNGLNMSYRSMSISTCGIETGLVKLLENPLPVTLSISLHAADDQTRSKLMPSNKAMGLDKLIAYGEQYFQKTKRRVTYEYIMIENVTDTPGQAKKLAERLKNTTAHVNLITLNPVKNCDLRPSAKEKIKQFAATLTNQNIKTTIRRRLGDDIKAACGQLRGEI